MHEHLHERRAERIGPKGRVAVGVGEEHVAGDAREVVGATERIGDPLAGRIVDGPKDPLLGDQLEVAVLERHGEERPSQ